MVKPIHLFPVHPFIFHLRDECWKRQKGHAFTQGAKIKL